MTEESDAREAARKADAISLLYEREGLEDVLTKRRKELTDEFLKCGHDEDRKRYWLQQALILIDMLDEDLGGYIMEGMVGDQMLIAIMNERAARPVGQDARDTAAVA